MAIQSHEHHFHLHLFPTCEIEPRNELNLSDNVKTLADLFESVAAAIFLDGGLLAASHSYS